MKTLPINDLVAFLNKTRSFRLAFLGDSITSTEWIHPNWREIVEYVIKDATWDKTIDPNNANWGIRCFNCGFDGSTTEAISLLMNDEVFSLYPDMVIYQIGNNDADLGVSVEQYRKNVEENIDRLLTRVKKLVITSDIYPGNKKEAELFAKYVPVVREIAQRKDVVFVDIFEQFAKLDIKKFCTMIGDDNPVVGIKKGEIDFLHPNSLGNAYLAKIILKGVFEIEFDPEKYLDSLAKGFMSPMY